MLASAQERDPANRDLLVASVQYHAKLGQHDAAAPNNPAVAELQTLVAPGGPVGAPTEGH